MNKRKQTKLVYLVNPFDYEWPAFSITEESAVLETLKRHLSALRRPSINVPLPKNTPKEERRQRRCQLKEEILSKEEPNHEELESKRKALRNSLTAGAASLQRLLPTGSITVVILDKNCDPIPLSKLLVPVCRKYKTLVVAVRGLSECMSKTLNLNRCSCLGLKTEVKHPDNVLHQLYKEILKSLNVEDKSEQMEPVKDVLKTGKRNASSLEFDESRDALGQSESKYQYRPLQILQIETETEVKAKMTKKNKKMHSKAKNEMQKT
ncbi:uncharacterized protein LOC136030469 [Artemia franciscana]